MPKQSPHGNLTAILVCVALLDLVFERLLGRLFLSPGCAGGFACGWARMAPFFLYLAGLLALVVGAGGMIGHLRRGELFPRGVRFTVAGLSLIFWLLVAMSLMFGRMPERYQFMLEASFGFVVALMVLSFLGSRAASARTRLGFLLFALPTLLHVAALLMARRHGPVSPERLAALGELTLLAAAAAAPLLLLPHPVPRARLAAGLAMAAGLGAFFSVAYLARTDLLQTVVLYTVQLELPRAGTLLGGAYVVALAGFVTAAGVLLLTPGPARLSGLGLCLMGSAGYQTSSPVALSLAMCGLVALSTGTLRMGGLDGGRGAVGAEGMAQLSTSRWRTLLGAIAAGLTRQGRHAVAMQAAATVARQTPAGDVIDSEVGGAESATVEVLTDKLPGTVEVEGADSDVGVVRASHRGHAVVVRLSRTGGLIRSLEVALGTPPAVTADASIEPHEIWMARPPEERPPHDRVKTGDASFDRVLGVYGPAPLQDRALRRRLLHLDGGTVSLWRAGAARFTARASTERPLRGFTHGPAASGRAVVDIVDVLCDLLEAGEATGPPESAG